MTTKLPAADADWGQALGLRVVRFDGRRAQAVAAPQPAARSSLDARSAPCARRAGAGASGETAVRLTQRERDVFRLLLDGQSSKQIARNLGIAVPTVKTYVGNIIRAMNVSSRFQVVAKAHQLGLVRSILGADGMSVDLAPVGAPGEHAPRDAWVL